jgi:hypothetical protein
VTRRPVIARRARIALALGLTTLAGALPTAAGARAPFAVPARLQGTFAMTGQISRAVNVPGERAGHRVSRTWVFTSLCPTGPCAQVLVVRGRGRGVPRVKAVLTLHSPGYYIGQAVFYAPLRCGSRIYRPGERVHYRLAVRITAATPVAGQAMATTLVASYASGTRDNMTPCVDPVGQRDAASYAGALRP